MEPIKTSLSVGRGFFVSPHDLDPNLPDTKNLSGFYAENPIANLFVQEAMTVNGEEKVAITEPFFKSKSCFNRQGLENLLFHLEIVDHKPTVFVLQNGTQDHISLFENYTNMQDLVGQLESNSGTCCMECGGAIICGTPACCLIFGFPVCCG